MKRITAVLALLSLAIPCAAAPLPGDKGPAFVPFPGGIADAAGKRAYVTNADGGIDALNLETGKVLWTSKDASKPLALAGDKVLAQANVAGKANQVRVVVLDGADGGKKVLASDALVFPDWVAVGLAYGRSFVSQGGVHGDDLWVRWQARAWYAGGARPTPEIEKAARKNADGAARVNLKTGKVEMLAADKMPAAPGPKVPAGVEKAAGRMVWNGSEMVKQVQTAGKLAVAVDQEKGKLILKRWDLATGKEMDPLTLLEARAFRVELAPAAGYVLAHKALAKEALPAGDYAWWVFELATGKQVAKFEYDPSTESATALGPNAYVVVLGGRKGPRDWSQSRTLKAVELKTGKVAWSHEIEPRRMLPPVP